MNRLKKKAWAEFILCGICVLITIAGTILMAHTNAKGLGYLLIWVVVGAPTGLFMYVWEQNKLKQFDERERALMQKAFSASMMAFAFYLLTFSLAAFFLIGGSGSVPVVFMPLMFFTGLFFAQTIYSFILLMQCAREDDE